MGIGGGNNVWKEFLHSSQSFKTSTTAAALFNLHHVVDTFSHLEACTVGVELHQYPVLGSSLCSLGRGNRQNVFVEDVPYRPLIAELHGFVFTDVVLGGVLTSTSIASAS